MSKKEKKQNIIITNIDIPKALEKEAEYVT